ncbi:SusC/RagA family TonB-linked outer membrane protein [Flavobacterium sp.]|uniref:SusC/RagA family TonB-linked outer membrane protein n=1 Tax=Flavobacterium sp. TaxID=239 RepID=UPI002C710809|nr:SusC/RagA family TonB-linked outer membrane protein [Flavobacterium sp.]HSD07683.1 SusC/RagA family TonB-linked outer membrane protein [Flavobacterium sp.]
MSHKKYLKSLFCIFLLFTVHIYAQQQSLQGIVVDAKTNLPLVGATGNSKTEGVITNENGEFIIQNQKLPFTLKFSYIGYKTQEIVIRSFDFLTVKLIKDSNELEEVVVSSGYMQQNKKVFSSAVSTISAKQLANKPATSFDQLLGGQTTGVDIIAPTSALNNTPVMRIRGISTITSGLYPLVVIDGVTVFVGSVGGKVGNNPLSDINPNDIQSIDVLKDASAAAIYGSRAANGVMVITTKKGKKGKPRVNYDSWFSMSTPYNLPKLLNAEQYTMIKNEAMVNSGKAPGYALSYNQDGSIVDTNWYDVAFKPGFSNNQNISISGANDATSYFFSTGYTNQNSYIKNNTFERLSARLNIEHQVNKKLKFGANVTYDNGKNVGPETGAIPSNSMSSSAYNSQYITNESLARMTYVLPSNVPVYNADGSYSIQNGISVGYGANNPSTIGTINAYNLAMVQELDWSSSENHTLMGNVFGEINLIKDLKFRSNFGLNNLQVVNKAFLNPIHGGGAASNGVATNTYTEFRRSDFTNSLIYEANFKESHHVYAMLGLETIKTTTDGWGAQKSDLTDPSYTNFQGTFINIAPYGSVYSENALLSYFSNVSYDYNRKYLLSFNFRRDGLSALTDGNKYGNFAGGSVGWNVYEEDFYKDSAFSRIISNLKLRASYGIVGNSEIGDYPAFGTYNSYTYGGVPTLAYSQTANPNLKWETSTKTDLGFNFSMFNDRLNLEFDYYNNVVDDLILKTPQSLSAGIPGNYINSNVGSLYNRGIELGINVLIVDNKDFRWKTNFNFSTLENKVTALASDVFVPSVFGVQNMTRVGYSIGSVFAVPCNGVNPDNGLMMFTNSAGKVVQYNHIGSPKWTYLDGTAAPAIDNYKDGVIQGPSLPKISGGFNNEINYKNFDLNFGFTFVSGNKLYNGTRATNSDQRYFNNGTFILDRWTTPGQKTEIQKLQYGDNVSAGFSFSSTSKVENGDYIKLKNISLGYNLPLKGTSLANQIASAHIYIQSGNVLTFTKYRGSDPEVSINGNSIDSGKDQNVPPNARVFTFGINVGF